MRKKARLKQLTLGIATALLAGSWQAPAWAAEEGPIKDADKTLTENTTVTVGVNGRDGAASIAMIKRKKEIDLAGYNLDLRVDGLTNASTKAAGIYLGDRGGLTLFGNQAAPNNRGLLNISVVGAIDEAGKKGAAVSGIHINSDGRKPEAKINADVTITQLKGGKDPVRGIWATRNAKLDIQGKFTIASGAVSHRGMDQGWVDKKKAHTFGMHLEGNNNKVHIDTIDIDDPYIQRGIQLGTEGMEWMEPSGNVVRIGGGKLKIKENAERGHWLMYLIGSPKVYINAGGDEEDEDAPIVPGDRTVELEGAVHIEKDAKLHLGLKGAASSWKGGTEKDAKGTVNLFLLNGATWDTSNGGRGSRITKLSSHNGTEGHIRQNDKGELHIENYAGKQKLFYTHTGDGTSSRDYAAGDTHIKTAESGSTVTMVTENTGGIDTQNEEQVQKVLSALAGKLYYDEAKNGTTHLKGTAMIAEGLTGSSAATGEMVFNPADGGQGNIKSAGPLTFNRQIADNDWQTEDLLEEWGKTEYSDGKSHYTFKQDVELQTDAATGKAFEYIVGGLMAGSESMNKDGWINMNGHKLKLRTKANSSAYKASGISIAGNSMEIKNSGGVDIEIKGNQKSQSGIYLFSTSAGAKLTIHNDNRLSHAVKIRNEATGEKEAAILVDGAHEKAQLDIKGLVDIEQDGDILQVKNHGSEASIGGGRLIAKGEGNAVRMTGKSKVYINAKANGDDLQATSDATDPRDVQMEGNVVLGGGQGDFGMALNTKSSYFTGLIGMEDTQGGKTRMILSDGAQWRNKKSGRIVNGFSGSYLTRLQANGGAIYQKDSRPITIDSYKGNMKVFYDHKEDGTKPEHYEGGALHIKKADADSAVTMVTERNGVKMNSALQTRKVLKALAGKLYYEGAKRGETNLKGKAMIAEGLTLSSQAMKIEDILFDKATGQGGIKNYRGRQIAEGSWDGADDEQDHWKEKGVRASSAANRAKYTFHENTTLSVDAARDQDLVQGSSVDALSAYSPLMWGQWSEGEINMKGHDLTLSAGASKKYQRPDKSWTGAESVGLFVGGGTLEMKELGAFSIKAKDYGIQLLQHSNLYIKNAGDAAHAVKIESEDKGIYMKNHDGSARLHIAGMVDIKAPTGIVVDGGELRIGGGKIVSRGQEALYVNSPGTAYINEKEDHDVQIEGDIQVKGSSAAAHIALTTKDSILKGLFTTDMYTWPLHQWELASGKGTLVLKNGGTWEHIKVGNVKQDKNGTAEVGDSRVSHLKSAGGIIRQKDKRKILIDKFSGDAKIYYDHKNDGTRAADYEAGDVNVDAAEANSRITMVTENNGITMSNENQVRKALNALAGKLYYNGARFDLKNLKGKAMIAEGLTTPSAARDADIVFKKEDGQGGIDMTPQQPPTPPQPVDTEEQIAELGTSSAAQVEKWKQKNLRDDAGNYTFAKGAKFHVKASDGSKLQIGDSVSNILMQDQDGSIDMRGEKLTLEATADSDAKRAGSIRLEGGSLEIKNAGAVDISISGDKKGASAIYAAGSSSKAAKLHIKNGEGQENAVKIRNTAKDDMAAAVTAKKTGANSGNVTIQGLADIEQEGAELLHADGGEISIGGGRFIAKGDNARAVKIKNGGKVYINAQADGDGVNAVSDSRDVKMEGDVMLDDFSGGTFGAALMTKDSYIKGRIGRTIENGSTRLYLANGAHWDNVSKGSTPTDFEGSYITHLKAKNGKIFQNDTKPLTIERLSGSLTLHYKHGNDGTRTEDYGSDPTYVDPNQRYGDTHIKQAAENSSVTMVTDSNGVELGNENAVRKTLNALAGKLYYDGYAKGERNLKGKAMIAEGLTGSAVSQQLDLDYRDSDGRARVKSNDTPSTAAGTIKKQIAEGNYDDVEDVQEFWKKKGVYDGKGNYTFHHDIKLEVKAADKPVISVKDNKFGTIYWNGDVKGSIDMTGHRLDIKAGPGGHGLFPNQGPQSGWERTPNAITVYSGTLTIKNVKGMNIESDPKGSLYGRGIFVMGYPGGPGHNSGHGHAKLVIENDDDPAHAVRIRVNHKNGEDFGAIEARKNMGSAEVDIKGLVDIDSKMWRAVESHGAKISIGGGTITGSDVASIAAYDDGTVFVNSKLDGNGNVVATSRTRPVRITGDISSESNGHVVLGLNNKESFFKGLVSTDIWGVDKANQKPYSYIPGNVSMLLANGAIWEHKQVGTGYHHKKETGARGKGIAMDSRVTRLQADKGILKQNDPHKITIDNYSGNMQLVYQHEGDGTKAEHYKAGDVHIKKAAENSSVTMVTDSNGLTLTDETQVYKTLNALAGKLYYDGYKTGERNLKGEAMISEGLVASSKTLKKANMDWSEASGQGSVKAPEPKPGTDPQKPGTDPQKPGKDPQKPGTDPQKPGADPQKPGTDPQKPGTDPQKPGKDPQKPGKDPQKPGTNPQKPKIEYGDYETKLMSGVKSAMTASTIAWRAEANDLMKRMGDLRLSPENEGVWARVYRGKSSSNKDKTNFSMNYTTIQVGYDKKVGDDWRVGVAGSYMKGSSSYESGSGENKEGNLGVYGTWTGKNGEYVDLIAKIGRLANEYTVYNDFGHYVKGDFHTWGGSLSAEYGRRISLKGGSFVEPQIELIYSHLNGVNYTGDTDYVGRKMHVRQGAMNSFVSRLGVGFGQETERGTWFLKASLYHEFAGDISTDYSDGFTPKSTTQRGKDTWVGIQLGGTAKLNDKTSLYGTFEKTFGGDIKTDWRVDAGLRWSF